MMAQTANGHSAGQRAANDKAAGPRDALPSYEVVVGNANCDRDRATAVWQQSGFGGLKPELQRERYDWFYLLNPQGIGELTFLRLAGDCQDLGFLGVGMRDWLVGDQPRKGGVLVDFVVHPSHRTAAPALMLQRKGRERAAQRASILTGLPDTKAVAVFKRLGSQFQCQLPRYVRILRYGEYFRRHMPACLARPLGWVVERLDRLAIFSRITMARFEAGWVEEFDDRFDALWSRLDKTARCIGVRNAQFLKWRFGRQPGRSYMTYTVSTRGDSRLHAYFVCELQKETLVVKDLLATGSSQRLRIALLALSRAARKLNAAAVSVQVFGDDELVKALRATQFLERDRRPFFAMVPGRAAESAGQPAWYSSYAWYITQADEDI